MIHPAASNVRRISARVESLNVLCAGVTINLTGFLADIGKGLGSTPSFDRITARSITFCNSRTFPGQEYEMNASSISFGI
jgi:hypothetical protein